ncbi:MAG TPA: hypothetical protein VLK66_01140 [Longimicrobium sp.]|nr:hypothetical protein [Longimicrobium sp.]
MKIRIHPASFLCLVAPLAVAACRERLPPDAGQLRERFGVEIPAYWHASAFHLEASQLRGAARDHFLGRFRATIALTAPTYVEDHRVGDTLFIRQAGNRGDFKTVYGRADATFTGGDWSTRFQMENDPTRALGQPRDFFTAARVIVVGSVQDRDFQYQQQLAAARAQLEAQAQAELQQQAARTALEDALVGEWRGTVMGRRGTRLVVTREDGALVARYFEEDYVETLRVEMMPGGSFVLTGIDVVKTGGGKVNWNFDTFQVQPAAGILTGTARDARHSGRIAMRQLDGDPE